MNNYSIINSNKNLKSELEHLFVFTVSGGLYAINIKFILEVINFQEIEIPANTPLGIIGIFNYNGVMTNVIDICALLGINSGKFSVNDKFVIIVCKDNCFALRADNIIDIYNLDNQNIQQLPFDVQNSFIKEVYKYENSIFNIINVEALNESLANNKQKNSINYSLLLPKDEQELEILKLRKEDISKKNIFNFPIEHESENQFLLFTLDSHNYFIELKYIKEFICSKQVNITKLPYTDEFVKGIINSRGDFLIVIDLNMFLNNENNDIKPSSKLIITEGKNFNIALLVDDVKYIKNLKNIEKNNIYTGHSKYIISEFTENGELYNIINYDKIINDERIYIDIG